MSEAQLEALKKTVDDILDLGVSPGEILMTVLKTLHGAGAVGGPDAAATDTAFQIMGKMKGLHDILSDPTHREDPATTRVRQVVQRLLATPPQAGPVDPQAAAMQCQILLKSGYQAQGALSTTGEGTLRLLAPGQSQGKMVLAEHFFDYSDVEAVVVVHEIPKEKKEESRIIIPKFPA